MSEQNRTLFEFSFTKGKKMRAPGPQIVTTIRDWIVKAILPVGYTPPRNTKSNARTKKHKAKRRRKLERLRYLEAKQSAGQR